MCASLIGRLDAFQSSSTLFEIVSLGLVARHTWKIEWNEKFNRTHP
jgi:hypothetical protein